MKSHTIHRTFNTERRREFIRITDDVQDAVDEAIQATRDAVFPLHGLDPNG